MNQNQNSNSRSNVRSICSVASLERRLDECVGSQDYVEVIHALVLTRRQGAVRVLATLLDSTGPIAEESIAGLVALAREGLDVVPAMRRCVDSDDYEMIRHAHRVLRELGDAASARWLREDDGERIDAYLDRKGFTLEDAIARLDVVLGNDGTDEEGVA
jgi:hypothetical protein